MMMMMTLQMRSHVHGPLGVGLNPTPPRAIPTSANDKGTLK